MLRSPIPSPSVRSLSRRFGCSEVNLARTSEYLSSKWQHATGENEPQAFESPVIFVNGGCRSKPRSIQRSAKNSGQIRINTGVGPAYHRGSVANTMSILKRIFGGNETTSDGESSQQAVLVYLNGTALPDEVYDEYDLETLESKLIEILERDKLGEYDGNEFGPTETILFMYGPDAERLFAGIEGTLRAYPLCQRARVEIRQGEPGAPMRELQL